MELKSSLNCSIPPDLNGRSHCGYGGAIIPEHINSQRFYSNAGRKKSKVHLNDQEKMIKIAAPREHPYSSHISRFAMFPSFRSPDDTETGVRQLNILHILHIVIAVNYYIVLPYNNFLQHTNPMKGENHVLYPNPPKTVLPNPKPCDWDFSSSEWTSNMLKNLERIHWVTSYQMHYTAEKAHWEEPFHKVINSPVIGFLAIVNQRTALAPQRYRELSCPRRSHTNNKLSAKALHMRTRREKPAQSNLMIVSCNYPCHRAAKRLTLQSAVAKNHVGIDSNTELLSTAALEQDKLARVRELSHIISNPCVLPRPPVLPGIHPVDRVGTMGRGNSALSLLDLQNSFSKSEAHHNFNSSITRAAVSLRDNVVTGKKHDFYGINCYYLRG
uniref:Uncharacterized protein n=1 Tax=Seriola lalandi dorsalis TaxID=1841481 RepID=A0A3B4XUB0_SERLL